jgi:hypothetical protein
MLDLTRLVTESLARHGFDRPPDYRRLRWSRWFRCESHHSLLSVPSQPGVFAMAEEIMDFASTPAHVAADAFVRQPATPDQLVGTAPGSPAEPSSASRRMLAVTQFFEDDDMAFVLDRMLSYQNPMRARLASGRYFVRFVVIEDQAQRRSVCNALNQWINSSTENVGRTLLSAAAEMIPTSEVGRESVTQAAAPQPSSGAAENIHAPSPLPSGF